MEEKNTIDSEETLGETFPSGYAFFLLFLYMFVCFLCPEFTTKKVDLEGGKYVYMYIYMCVRVCSVDTFGINSEESASHSKHPATLCDVSCLHVGMPSTL